MGRKNLKHLEKIKDVVYNSNELTDKEKSLAIQKIQEWYKEDQALKLLELQLINVAKKIVPILKEMGLL